VGVLSGFIDPMGACVDPAGNVYVASLANRSGNGSIITEFAHGGTTAIVTLQYPYVALGCAIDPKTGDLAVSGHAVAIYADARGTPAIYSSTVYGFAYCGYDDNSNLFLYALDSDGTDLVRLAAGSNSFQQISLPVKLISNELQQSSVLWDGKYLAVSSSFSNAGRDIGPVSIYRFRVNGSKAKLISTATLTSQRNKYTSQFWLQGRSIVGTDYHRSQARVSTWRYPRGGKTQRVLVRFGQGEYGATVVSGLPSI
jgi:DNA-binding beta-propeller fold protein YncE